MASKYLPTSSIDVMPFDLAFRMTVLRVISSAHAFMASSLIAAFVLCLQPMPWLGGCSVGGNMLLLLLLPCNEWCWLVERVQLLRWDFLCHETLFHSRSCSRTLRTLSTLYATVAGSVFSGRFLSQRWEWLARLMSFFSYNFLWTRDTLVSSRWYPLIWVKTKVSAIIQLNIGNLQKR